MTDAPSMQAGTPRHTRAVLWACGASVLFHLACVAVLIFSRLRFDLGPRPDRITDVAGATVLAFVPEQPHPEPAPVPAQAPPAPEEHPSPQPTQIDDDFGATQPVPPPPVTAAAPSRSLISDAPASMKAVAAAPKPVSEPRASFAGVEASPARRIVYLVDASGAMASSLKFVKEELTRSVARLNEDQFFQVIVFRQPVGSQATSLSYFAVDAGSPSLAGATRQAKVSLAQWLPQVRPGGKSDILAAINAAIDQDPDLIFLLTRSINRSVGFDVTSHNQSVLESLDRSNPKGLSGHRKARIKTIQFLDDDPTGLLQEIARIHGDGDGSYRLVGRSEVLQQAREEESAQPR